MACSGSEPATPQFGEGLFLHGCPVPGKAFVRTLTDAAEKPTGPHAIAAPGDVMLANESGRELAERAVAEAQSSELDRAREAWQRKFSGLPTTREEYARHARFLQGRGFSFDTIRTVLKRDSE